MKTNQVLTFLWTTAAVAYGQLNPALVGSIRANMDSSSWTSWEMGTQAETLLELDFPAVSVFGSHYLSSLPSASVLNEVISIAQGAIQSAVGGQLGGVDGAAGDPASIGVAVLLASKVNAPGEDWLGAASNQLQLLLKGTPRDWNGAISHRVDDMQYWSDFMYMVPPFLAYYGAVTSNYDLLLEAYTQCALYRTALYDADVSLWRHIYTPATVNGTYNSNDGIVDGGHWSTGNGWAAAGMLRVLATIKGSPFASQLKSQQGDLNEWITEIHTGMTNNLPASGIFTNYVDQPGSFADASGTALFAATVYRHYLMDSSLSTGSPIFAAANSARTALFANGGATHLPGGWLTPVVNPDSFGQQGANSPEAECFVLQLNNNWNALSSRPNVRSQW